MVIKVKWLPWILLIGGLITIFCGAGNIGTFIVTIIGGVWVYYQVKGNKKVSVNSTRNNNIHNNAIRNNNNINNINNNHTTTVIEPESLLLCPNCKSVINEGMKFCSKCGTKLK